MFFIVLLIGCPFGQGGLIKEELHLLQAMGSEVVFVLEHKEYYPKYGFTTHAAYRGYLPPYPMPEKNELQGILPAICSV